MRLMIRRRMVRRRERLVAWRVSHEFGKAVSGYRIVSEERAVRNCLTAAGECHRFLDIAWGSLAEMWYLLLFSEEMECVAAEQRKQLE